MVDSRAVVAEEGEEVRDTGYYDADAEFGEAGEEDFGLVELMGGGGGEGTHARRMVGRMCQVASAVSSMSRVR